MVGIMTSEDMSTKLLRVQLELVALRERLDRADAENEKRDARLEALANGFDTINNTLKQIKWIGLGMLLGGALVAGEQILGVLKFVLAAL
jgi:hypothetical protein